jgi:mono/diheme cytochrome c family protein
MAAVVAFGAILTTAGSARAADGAALWEKNCVSCHGKDGKGDTKAGKLTKVTDLTAAKLTREQAQQTIEQGVTDKATGKTRMKGYKDKFSAEEIEALSGHVLTLTGPAK